MTQGMMCMLYMQFTALLVTLPTSNCQREIANERLSNTLDMGMATAHMQAHYQGQTAEEALQEAEQHCAYSSDSL